MEHITQRPDEIPEDANGGIPQYPIVTTDRAIHADTKSAVPQKDALIAVAFRLLGPRLWDKSYTLLSESRSFLGRLRTQLAKDRVSLSLGKSLEPHHQGWRRNRRTLARKKGIEKLLATRPWLTPQDFETFLAGFDAGEQWAFDSLGSTPRPGQHESINTSDSI